MITKITSVEELAEMFVEILLSNTDKVSKVSEGSVLRGVAYGVANLGQKAEKDIALIESHLFPEDAYGDYLDNIAKDRGVSDRFGTAGSTVWVRVVGDSGTSYLAGTHTFTGNHGIVFEPIQNFTINDFGYGYIKVRSTTTGVNTNVNPSTLTQVSPVPAGHQYCINEYMAIGGRDVEEDELFKKRIQESSNILATGTLSRLEQIFIKINTNVLKLFKLGMDDNGNILIGVATVNGIDLNDSELNDLLIKGDKYFGMTEYKSAGSSYEGIVLKNISYQPIDISFRCQLQDSYDPDDVRKNIQIGMSKLLDFRYWEHSTTLQWIDLLNVVKFNVGIKYVYDDSFYPAADILIDAKKLPIIRGFQMLDKNGNIIQDLQGNLNPVYYPNQIDFSLQSTVLTTI